MSPSPTNPYIAGRALGQARGFVGRNDILRLVESSLRRPEQNALVLFGQRRIGKTSILLQLRRRLPAPPFVTVYIDLMDRARRPLGQLLAEIAQALADEASMPVPEPANFDDRGLHFRRVFLPALYAALGEERTPVLLLDEFDVLDDAAKEQLPDTAAAQAFFPYLRELLDGEPRLKFVFVVGRRAEDLSINVKATFKASLYQRVSVLDEAGAREVILTAERQNSLCFETAAIEHIIALTGAHPYFTQLLCQIVWDNAHSTSAEKIPLVDEAAVETAAQKALEAGQNVFEWIWDGLPPAERVIFAAIAEATEEQTVVTEDELTRLLQSRGIRILTRELELAPRTLIEWELLREVNGGYRFFIEMMRRWVRANKPLPKVKDEIDRVVPLADTLYRSGEGFYRQHDPANARDLLLRALQSNPNHLKARLLLGQILLEAGHLDDAIQELEEAYRYDEEAARYALVRALQIQGEDAERKKQSNRAEGIYRYIVSLSPNEYIAVTKLKEIEQTKREIDRLEEEALLNLQSKNWNEAARLYTQLLEQNPENNKWKSYLDRCLKAQIEDNLYADGKRYFANGEIEKSIATLLPIYYNKNSHLKTQTMLLASSLGLIKTSRFSTTNIILTIALLTLDTILICGTFISFSYAYNTGSFLFVGFTILTIILAVISLLTALTTLFIAFNIPTRNLINKLQKGDFKNFISDLDYHHFFIKTKQYHLNKGVALLLSLDKAKAISHLREYSASLKNHKEKQEMQNFISYLEQTNEG